MLQFMTAVTDDTLAMAFAINAVFAGETSKQWLASANRHVVVVF